MVASGLRGQSSGHQSLRFSDDALLTKLKSLLNRVFNLNYSIAT